MAGFGAAKAEKPKCSSQRTSLANMSRRSGMPYFSIPSRSMPKPKANPCQASGSRPQFCSTLGCTIPQPTISIHSSPWPIFTSPPERSQRTSISALGSVNGKWCGRKRVSTSGVSKKRLMKVSSVHFRWPIWMARSITSPSIWWNIGVCVASESER